MDMKILGKTIAALREEKKIGRKRLGELIGRDASNLYRLERGLSTPDIGVLDAIARALGTSLHALIAEAELGAKRKGALPDNVSFVPLLTLSEAATTGDLSEVMARARSYIPLEMIAPPGAFAVSIPNDAMEPHLPRGGRAILCPGILPVPGKEIALIQHHRIGVVLRRIVQDGLVMVATTDHWRSEPEPMGEQDRLLGWAIATVKFQRF